MTESNTFEDRFAEQLRALAEPAGRPPRREAVASAVEAARNVGVDAPGVSWPRPGRLPLAFAAAASAVVLVVVGIGFLRTLPNQPGLGAPAITETPTPTASPSPNLSAAQTARGRLPIFPTLPGHPKPVAAGTYTLDPRFIPVPTTFVVPDGWLSCTNNAGLLCLADGTGGVEIWVVTNVVADPCDKSALRNPAVGPTVEDLVTAISGLPWSAVTPSTDITVDGFRGKEFEVTGPTNSPCVGMDGFATWTHTLVGPDMASDVGPGERLRLRVLDVDGTRVVIAGSYAPGTTSEHNLAEINAIIESVRFGR
jgi:hypothetical protein